MGMHTKAILDLIERRPGVRTVEIADLIDCELDIVEASIKDGLLSGAVKREQIIAPNGRPTYAYRMREAKPAPEVVEPEAAPEPSPKLDPAARSEPPAPSASPAPIASSPGKTKVEIAMDFIRSQPSQSASDDDLRFIMNLRPDQSPSAFLQTQRKNGEIYKEDGVWKLGMRTTLPKEEKPKAQPRSQPRPAETPVTGDFRCALWNTGELQLARGEQIAMRLTAAEVGQLRDYLAGSRAAA